LWYSVMSIFDRRLWVRRLLIGIAAGTGAGAALWFTDKLMVAHGVPPEGTLLDELAVGALVAGLALLLDIYHETRVRRMREAAKLTFQLNHYIRNSLQVILSANTLQADPGVRQAVSRAIAQIEWVLDKIVQENELFADVGAYLEKKHAELDLESLLNTPPEGVSASNHQGRD
jgi:hypothetical protein